MHPPIESFLPYASKLFDVGIVLPVVHSNISDCMLLDFVNYGIEID
jgi:hypothetical protein